ncbi:MAG: DUF5009 domain-containing protein [Ignavibacteriales bacterium]|nr:DUF5009 domain-containing protein [Ignavibacteriales bacterium]
MDSANSKRSLALDALRGFAIFTMILSSRIPFGVLPGWMYHAQIPPPLHKFLPTHPGISWVDLVFPFFLFSMGAAFPFALQRRMKQGASNLAISLDIIKRGILLMLFAIIIMHTRPHTIDPQLGISSLFQALLLFGLMFLVFWRYPETINRKVKYALQSAGFLGLALFLIFITYPNGTGFSLLRYDIIILVLSNVAIAGSFIYLLTKGKSETLLFILLILIGIRLAFSVETSWIHSIGVRYPSWMLFQLTFLKYLFIIIPGILTGTVLYEFQKRPKTEILFTEKDRISFAFAAISILIIIIFSLFGLYTRMVMELFIFSSALLAILWFLMKDIKSEYGVFLKQLLQYGILWFTIGMLFEPFEGGIKKDPSTISYYFVTSGLAVFLLIAFMIGSEVFNIKKGITILAENGQNPMLAYAAGTNLLTPVVLLTFISQGLDEICLGNPWLGVLKGIFITSLLALAIKWFTRKKIFWRT